MMIQQCVLHQGTTLTHYCDSCKDVVCSICIQIGPHADIRHQIMTIEQAVQIRQRFYYTFRDLQIFPIRQRSCLKIKNLQIEQLNLLKQKKVVQKDINLQFEGINNRINQKVNHQIVNKQTEIKVYQQLINNIDDLAYSFQSIIQFPQRFLLCYQTFNNQLKHLESFNFQLSSTNSNIQQQFYQSTFSKNMSSLIKTISKNNAELPRQFALTVAKAAQLPLYKQKNDIFNSLIDKSINYSKKSIIEARMQIMLNKKKVLHLYNNQNSQLLNLHTAYVCAFCLAPFTIEENNQFCSYNKNFKAQPTYKDIQIPVELKGNKIHYWVAARKAQRPIPSIKTHQIIRNLHKKQFYSSLKDIKRIKTKLQKYDIDKNENNSFLNQFRKDDPQQTGKVSALAFMYILTNKFDIDEIQAEVLSQLCLIKENNLVDYNKIKQVIEHPFQFYNKFLVQEEQLQKSKSIAPASFKYKY